MNSIDDNVSIQELISKVKTALKVGDYEEALDAVNKALEIEPNNQEANELAMQVHEKRQRSNLMQAKRWLEIGQAAYRAQKFDEALNAFQRLIDLSEKNAQVQEIISREKIRDLLNECREKQSLPRDIAKVDELTNVGKYEQALDMLKEYSDNSVGGLRKKILGFQKLRLDAQTALGVSNFEGAVRLLKQLKKDTPHDPFVSENLPRALYGKLIGEGKEFLKDGKYDEAAKKFEEAQGELPAEDEPRKLLAEVDEKRVIRRGVESALAMVRSAIAAENYEEAVRQLDIAIEKEPERIELQDQKATLIEKARQYTNTQSIRLTEEGQKYLDMGDFETASRKFSEALQFDPQSESAAKGMVNLRYMMKRRQEADAAFNTAKASFDGRDYETAETYLLEAIDNASDRKAVEDLLQKTRLQRFLVRARTYLVQRQFPKVEAELEQAQKQFPDRPEVQKLFDELFIGRKTLEAEVDIQANDYEGVLEILAEISARFGEIGDPRLQELRKTAEHRKKQASDTKTSLGKGFSALRIDDYDEALKQYQVAMDNAPVDSEEYQQALEGYTQVLEKKNSEAIIRIETRLGYAEKALAERDYEVALGYVAGLEKEYRNGVLGIRNLSAGLEKRMLDVRETATHAKAAHERAEVLIRQGQEALNQGNYDVAIDSFKQAETEDPNNTEIKSLRTQTENNRQKADQEKIGLAKARSAFHVQDYVEAWKKAQAVLDVTPGQEDASGLQQKVLQELKDGVNIARDGEQFENALNLIRQWRAISPDNNEAADLEHRVKREFTRRKTVQEAYEKAQKTPIERERAILLQEVLNIDPHNSKVQVELTDLLDKIRRKEQIERLWESGRRSEESQDYSRAYTYYRQAVALNILDQTSQAKLDHLEQVAREFVDKKFELLKQYLHDARFEDALNSIEDIMRATWDSSVKQEALEKRRSVEKYYAKYREIKSAVEISNTYLDRFEFIQAEDNIRACINKLSEEDKFSPILGDIIADAQELIRKSKDKKKIKEKLDSLISHAQTAEVLKMYDEAIQSLSEAVVEAEKLKINSHEIKAHLEIILQEKQEQDKTINSLLEEAEASLAISDFAKVENLLQQIPEITHKQPKFRSLQNRWRFEQQEAKFRQCYESGLRYLRSGDYLNSIKNFEEALRIKPDDSKAKADLYEAQYNQQILDKKASQEFVEAGDRELDKGNLLLASQYYDHALFKDESNSEAHQKHEFVKENLDTQNRESRRNLVIWISGIIFTLLIIIITTFFAANGPHRLAALLAPTLTPTVMPTNTITPTITLTPVPTLTPSSTPPVFAADSISNQLLYYLAPENVGGKNYKGIWDNRRFYLCAYNVQHQSYLIAALPAGCVGQKNPLRLGWVAKQNIILRFVGDLPNEFVTPQP